LSVAALEGGECETKQHVARPSKRLFAAGVHVAARHIALPAETGALEKLGIDCGFKAVSLTAGFLPGCEEPLPALDFSDFVVLVRGDMTTDVAYLITWCLVETREAIERQYRHIPADRSPLTYPLDPARMSRVPIPYHPGAREYFERAGILPENQLS
jgi:uncharacterized protein